MNFVRHVWLAGRVVLLALVGWLSFGEAAWAQVASKPPPPRPLNSMTYVMAYFIVIFGIALGMLIVCRSSNRREKLRPEQYESKKLAEDEE